MVATNQNFGVCQHALSWEAQEMVDMGTAGLSKEETLPEITGPDSMPGTVLGHVHRKTIF